MKIEYFTWKARVQTHDVALLAVTFRSCRITNRVLVSRLALFVLNTAFADSTFFNENLKPDMYIQNIF